MSAITFEDRAVAFIDVLGFSGLTSSASTDAEALARLEQLVGLLESAVPALDAGVSASVPEPLIPQHTYVSDSIILSAPLAVTLESWSHYDGLAIVVMRAIQLTHAFASAGYLLRGGISIGKVWHTKSNIVGPAYIEAYRAEQSASAPRILLTPTARSRWVERRGNSSRMCIEYQGSYMVNGLFDYYVPGNSPNRVELALLQYESMANQAISACTDARVLEKWRWFKQYIADERPHALLYESHA